MTSCADGSGWSFDLREDFNTTARVCREPVRLDLGSPEFAAPPRPLPQHPGTERDPDEHHVTRFDKRRAEDCDEEAGDDCGCDRPCAIWSARSRNAPTRNHSPGTSTPTRIFFLPRNEPAAKSKRKHRDSRRGSVHRVCKTVRERRIAYQDVSAAELLIPDVILAGRTHNERDINQRHQYREQRTAASYGDQSGTYLSPSLLHPGEKMRTEIARYEFLVAMIFWCSGIDVWMPSTMNIPRARCMRRIASVRSRRR